MIFAQRMLPHFMAGKSVQECARAVLDDDIRILNTTFANNRRGVEHGIMSELIAQIYREAKAAAKGVCP
jgi:hypothetical protein